MSFTPNKFLHSDPEVYLRCQQHAARIFTDDQFRLAPKSKNLFHVAFNINAAACKNAALIHRHKNEINMLVKSIDLPSFTINNELVNQYNRKKAVQYQHVPGDIAIEFHDDNMSLINQVWQNYYSYYYADSKSAQSRPAFTRNATRNSNFITNAYGFDNGSTAPFFNYITIYQMARHEYVSYKLINPIIVSWNHNKLNYSESKNTDFMMKIKYEAVSYGSGNMEANPPEGFGLEHYDNVPSPLSGDPDTVSLSPTFTNDRVNPREIVKTVTEQINTYQNTRPLSNAGISGIINSVGQITTGVQGIAFPTPSVKSTSTVASLIKIG